MSTRSIIGVYDNKSRGEWHGVYHHWDGNPSGVGSTLLELGKQKGYDFIKQKVIEDHPQGWSSINYNWDLRPVDTHKYKTPKKYNREKMPPQFYSTGAGQYTHEHPVGAAGSEYLYVISPTGFDIFQAYYNTGEYEGQRIVGFFGMGAPDIGKGEEVIWRKISSLKWTDTSKKIVRLTKRLEKEAA